MITIKNFNKKSIQTLKVIVIIAVLFALGCSNNVSKEISQWRGINRDGHYAETGLLNEWPESGPELVWVLEGLGNGYAAPSVMGDKIFINGEQDSISYLFAFDTSGNQLWKAPNGEEFIGSDFSSKFPGARSVPTVINNLVYTSSGKGRIACFEASMGVEKWAIDMVEDLGGVAVEFGYSESLVVDDLHVYCFPGGTTTNVAALDRFTGEIVWTTEALKDTTAYCSPTIINLPERDILVTLGRHNLFALDCQNGDLLWSFALEGYKWDGEHCNTPVYYDGHIYTTGTEDKGKGTVKLKLSDDGKSVEEVWNNTEVKNAFGGFVIVDNKFFTTIRKNYLKSLDLATGNVVDSIRVSGGSVIFADNKFICYGHNGEINLVNYQKNQLESGGKFRIENGTMQHFAHPVLDKGIMYIRRGDALMAYRIK